MNIVNTSILGTDSLLGEKYVLSSYAINGLEKVAELGTANGKDTYYNPYALAFATVYDRASYQNQVAKSNPFEYQNQLYSQLLGHKVELYTPVAAEMVTNQEGVSYHLTIPVGNFAVYGNLPWKSGMNATLDVNGYYELAYAQWTAPSVFYIPTATSDTVASVTLHGGDALAEEQFYCLDLAQLKAVTSQLQAKTPAKLSVQNGSISLAVTSQKAEDVVLAVTDSPGWTTTVNGEPIEVEHFAEHLISIPLEAGENDIKLQYHVPRLKIGIAISLGTALVMVVGYVVRKKRG